MKDRRTPQPTPTWCLICFSKGLKSCSTPPLAELDFQRLGLCPLQTLAELDFSWWAPCSLEALAELVCSILRHTHANSQSITRPFFKGQLDALSQSQPSLSNTSKSYSNETSYASTSKASNGLHMNTFCSGGSSKHRAEYPTNASPGAGAQASSRVAR